MASSSLRVECTQYLAQWQLQPTLRGGAAGAVLAPVTLAWDQLAWQAGALQTRGRLSGLPGAIGHTLNTLHKAHQQLGAVVKISRSLWLTEGRARPNSTSVSTR